MPDMPDKSIAQKLRENLAALRAQNAPREVLEQEVMQAQDALNRQSAADPERQLSRLDRAGAIAQEFGDNASFGLIGLADDLISSLQGGGQWTDYGQRIRQARDIRKETKERTRVSDPGMMLTAGLTGALANPATRLLGPAKVGKGVLASLKSIGKAGAEAATQGAANVVGQNVGTTEDPLGLNNAGIAAGMAAPFGLAFGTLGNMAPAWNALRKAGKASTEGTVFARLADRLKAADEANYGMVRAEARATPTTPALRQALEDPDLAPLMRVIDRSRKYRNASDATKAQIAYRLLSHLEGKGLKQQAGTTQFLADLQLKMEDIPLLKKTLVRGATRRSQEIVPGQRPLLRSRTNEQFDYDFEPTPLETPVGGTAENVPLRTAAEIRAERQAQLAAESPLDKAQREAREAAEQRALAGEGESVGWEDQPTQAGRTQLDRRIAEREVARRIEQGRNPAEHPVPYINPAGTSAISTREGINQFRNMIGASARREAPAVEPPWSTTRPYPKGEGEFARRWEQTFGAAEPPAPPRMEPQNVGQWVPRKVGEARLAPEVVREAVPPQTIQYGPAMPSWPKAISASRDIRKLREIGKEAMDVTKDIISGEIKSANKVQKMNPEIWKAKIAKMSKEEAQVALDFTLARLKEMQAVSTRVPLSKAGAVLSPFRAIAAPARMQEYVDLLERQAGQPGYANKIGNLWPGASGRLLSSLFTGQE